MEDIRDWFGQSLRIGVATDHGGLDKKELLVRHLQARGFDVCDLGPFALDPEDDYPDYAEALARHMLRDELDCGVLLCRSGIGMSIAANRFPGLRAALVESVANAKRSRQHNAANILVTGGDGMADAKFLAIVDAWFATPYSGEARHTRRLRKIDSECHDNLAAVRGTDPEITALVDEEIRRQDENLELIASENYTSPAVRAVVGSVMTNKYAEGYPGRRYYRGCEHVDGAEQLAIERACKLFGAAAANVQPHSGSQANMAVYFALLQPGDTVLAMRLDHGGHLTHGLKANFSGRFFRFVNYGVSAETERLDYDAIAALAEAQRPRLIMAGASAYPRVINFARLRQIADSVGAYLVTDMAHFAGLVAAGVHPSPVPHCDAVTATTHKTLRGPRGGLILSRADLIDKINAQVFPGIQGGPLMHVIAAKAVCFLEALQPEFTTYQRQIAANAKCLAAELAGLGFRIVSGGTDNHLMLVDLRPKQTTGEAAATALDRARITVNKNLIPFDPEPPTVTSGIRIGTPAVTTRGLKEPEMREIAAFIGRVIDSGGDDAVVADVATQVLDLTRRFPVSLFRV